MDLIIKHTLIVFFLICLPTMSWGETCTFDNGGGDGDWSNALNWDCGNIPADTDDIIIPVGFTVNYTGGNNIDFEGAVTIAGTLNFGTAHLHFTSGSTLLVEGTGVINAFEIKIQDGAVGTIENGGDINIDELEVQTGGTLVNDSDTCITVNDEFKNNGDITGTGCFEGLAVLAVPGFATCTFDNGGGDGTWNDATNWDCGMVPDLSLHNVVIPDGFNVTNDFGNLDFDADVSFTLGGTLDNGNFNIKSKNEDSFITISSTAFLSNVSEFKFEQGGDGIIEFGADVTVNKLKIRDDGSSLVINARCITVISELKNVGPDVTSTASITGSGCIDFENSDNAGKFENKGTGGFFGCTSDTFIECETALPIELIDFSAEPQDKINVKVEWSTASEINNDVFIVERSIDGLTWEYVEQIAGAGNSSDKILYSIVDKEPYNGLSYYRLTQVDYDGKSESFVICVTVEFESKLIVYPNPTNGMFTIQGVGFENVSLEILTLKGEVINSRFIKNDRSLVMNTEGWPSGIYYLRIIRNGISESKKLEVIK